MNSFQSHRRAGAFTLIELLCVIAIIGILAALLLPVLSRGQAQARRVLCGSNLGQAGIAFQIFMHDHAGKFPMQVPMSEGGSQEFVQNGYAVGGEFYFSFRHFQVLSNESITPRILICPADTRLPAASLGALQNENVSYFVGVNADYARPGSILAGDRNIANVFGKTLTVVSGGIGGQLHWTKEMHEFKGNVLFADGHVEEWNNSGLAASPNSSGVLADFFLPSIRPGGQIQPAYDGGNTAYNPPSRSTSPSASTPGYSSPDAKKQPASPASQPGYHPNPDALNNQAPAGQIHNGQIKTQNYASTFRMVPMVTNVSSIIITQDVTEGLSTFDKHVVKSLRPILEWSYVLILFLLLLFLALELWRRSQRIKKRKAGYRR